MKLIRRLARLRIAGQHADHAGHARSGAGAIVAMKDNEQTLAQRIKELEEALAAETRRREAAELRIAQLTKRQNELAAELAESQETQAKLREELHRAQQQLAAADLASLEIWGLRLLEATSLEEVLRTA